MLYVYVLRSASVERRFYTGQTDNIGRRLVEHNKGMVTATKSIKPLELVYLEAHRTRQRAVDRERYLKSAAGRRYLKKIFES